MGLNTNLINRQNGWMDGLIEGKKDEWMDRDGRMDGDRWQDGWRDGYVDGRIDEPMDGQKDRHKGGIDDWGTYERLDDE